MREIIPAILTNSFPDLKNKLKKIEGLSSWLQLDIMDGKFVKNVSLQLPELKKIKFSQKLEIHLMVENPEKYFGDCQQLKARRVIFHFEATKNPRVVLKEMGKYKFERGMALNPKTGIEKIKPYLKNLNLVLLLGVEPGFQGQKFDPAILKKIKRLKTIYKRIKIGVDGGVNLENIKRLALAGSNYFVVGSYLFKSKDIKKSFQLLKKEIQIDNGRFAN